ncbi:MAG TPA: tyrosine-type recombinase/integrase [Bacteroidales bacterium]
MTTLEAYFKQHYSPKSISNYLSIVSRFAAYMNNGQDKATYKDILEYIGYLRQSKLSPRSIHNYLHVVKAYYNWLTETNQRKDHPCKRLNLKDRINKSIAIESLYSMETLENLLQSHQSKNKTLQKRDECVISLLIYQALTVQEISDLELNNLNLDKGTIYIKAGRSNRSRTLSLKSQQIMTFYQYINTDRLQLLKKHKQATESDKKRLILSYTGKPILSMNITDILNPRRQNKPKLLPLKIRQSVLAHLLKQNHDVRIVQVFAGHRKAASTEEYKQTGLEELKTAVGKYHPLG